MSIGRHRARGASIVATTLLTYLLLACTTSCSGSTGKSAESLPGCANGSQDLCVVRCNLGCTSQGRCNISDIAVNQRIDFAFNFEIDPATVNTNTFKMRDARGNEPSGSFFVQGAVVSFIPQVAQSGTQSFFGFLSGRDYTLTIPGKDQALETLRSTSGDALGRGFTCQLAATRGIVDFDGRSPTMSLLVPDQRATCIPRDTQFLLEFSELVDPLTLSETARGVQFRLASPQSNGDCSVESNDIAGTRSINVDPITQRTRLTFAPSSELPSGYCVRVVITELVRDVSGRQAKRTSIELKLCDDEPIQRQIVEDFADSEQRDTERGGGTWADGRLLAPILGGSGRHGDFEVTQIATPTNEKDEQNRSIWRLDTDRIVVPKSMTLSAEDEIVTNGVLEFTSFVLPSGVRLRITGSKTPVLRVAGNVRIQGVLDLSGITPETIKVVNGLPPQRGQDGGGAGPGASGGGRGGDSPIYRGADARYDGSPGGPVQMASGHPLAASAAATAGAASRANPTSADSKDVRFSSTFGQVSQMTAAGGGGGGLLTPGASGRAIDNMLTAHNGAPLASDFGEASASSTPIELARLAAQSGPSRLLYLIGGSGGGGAGTHTSSWFPPQNNDPQIWAPGHGGGGGGGALHIQCGRDCNVATSGSILTRGGSGQVYDMNIFTLANGAPGGAGSGGSLLVQAGASFDIRGRIDARGGEAGHYRTGIGRLRVDSVSGAGGNGMLRFESDPPPILAQLTTLRPAVQKENVGAVSTADYSRYSVDATRWYDTGVFFTPRYLRYEIDASINGSDVIFSDDPTRGTFAGAGEPIEILFQACDLDPRTKTPIRRSISDWQSGTIAPLTSLGGNAFRVLLRFDKRGDRRIEVREMRFYFET